MSMLLSPRQNVPYIRGRDYHRLIGPLYQGAIPPFRLEGFDVIVFCAMEHQPMQAQHVARILSAPNDDSDRPMKPDEIAIAESAAKAVEIFVREKKRVLVTCMQGRNRSGLVSALAIMNLLGCSGEEAVKIVKGRRPRSLMNPFFVDYLDARWERDLDRSRIKL